MSKAIRSIRHLVHPTLAIYFKITMLKFIHEGKIFKIPRAHYTLKFDANGFLIDTYLKTSNNIPYEKDNLIQIIYTRYI